MNKKLYLGLYFGSFVLSMDSSSDQRVGSPRGNGRFNSTPATAAGSDLYGLANYSESLSAVAVFCAVVVVVPDHRLAAAAFGFGV